MSVIPTAFPEPGLGSSVWKLLRLRLVIMVNGFRRAKTRAKIGYIIAGIAILGLVALSLFISISLLGFLRSPQLARYLPNTASFLESFPTMIVSAAAIGILVTSFGVLLQALYLSGDMDFLMSAPIPLRAVFVSKLVQAVLPNFGFLCLLTLPILFGLGISSSYNILYYPLVVIVLAMISLAAASLASLLVMVVARFFPARRVAEVLGFIIGAFFMIFSQSARFMKFNVNDQQVTSMLNITGRFNQPWSPLAWSGQGLVDLGKGEWLPAIGLLAASLLTTGVIFFAALVTSERLYYTGWSSLQNNRRKAKAKSGAQARQVAQPKAQSRLAGLIPAPVRAILVKDLLVYRRDLRHISQLITPLILGVVYAISLLRSGGSEVSGQGNAPAWFMEAANSVVIYLDIALALFLGWMLVANLAGLGFSQEGKNYWILKTAPIKSRQLLAAKFLVGYIPSMLLCNVYLLILQILKGSSLWSMVVSMLAVSMMLAGLNGIYLYFGTRGAKFDWENPAHMNRAVGCLGSLVGFLFLPVCFLLFISPTFLARLLDLPLAAGQLVGLLLGGAASAAALFIPLGMVEKYVPTLAEA
jgi:ABC-2 type transport system permease protein